MINSQLMINTNNVKNNFKLEFERYLLLCDVIMRHSSLVRTKNFANLKQYIKYKKFTNRI